MNKELYHFQPDWLHEIPPGESIAERMSDLSLSQSDFAIRMGYSKKHIHKLLKGKVSLSEEVALRLEKVLDIPASFWMNLETNYRQALAQEKEKQLLKKDAVWLKKLPLKDMIEFKWVEHIEDKALQVNECLKFYGVNSVDAWETMQQKNYQAIFKSADKFSKDDIAIQTWLRQGEREAVKFSCQPFDKRRLIDNLESLRGLTRLEKVKEFLPQLEKICAACGVAVVFAPPPKNCPMSGATKWLSANKALLLLSLRHKTNDHLWFAFFHEMAHIIKHKKQLFLENANKDFLQDSQLEEEADIFAANTLIPEKYNTHLVTLKSQESIIRFAKKIGVAPGIVVGSMQYKKIITWDRYNKLKAKYRFA